jgi:small subunit ribosomal protein S17
MTEAPTRGQRKIRIGEVVSDRSNKTVVVRVSRRVPHPLYGKVVQQSSRFTAHDEHNDAHIGDTVRIVETRPLSKTKRWRVAEIVERAR